MSCFVADYRFLPSTEIFRKGLKTFKIHRVSLKNEQCAASRESRRRTVYPTQYKAMDGISKRGSLDNHGTYSTVSSNIALTRLFVNLKCLF
jgi:hypothetical protein